MTISGRIKEADYIAAQFLHMRPSWVFALVGILLIAVAVLALILKPSIIMGGLLAYLFATFALYIPYKARRTFRQYKALSEAVSMEIRDDGLFMKRENGEGLVPWSHIIKWRNNKKLVLLYPADNLFHLVPRHFFDGPESFSNFLLTLKNKLGHAK